MRKEAGKKKRQTPNLQGLLFPGGKRPGVACRLSPGSEVGVLPPEEQVSVAALAGGHPA